ncbi:MAG: glycosyltransferase family 4 protein [Clostridia bacterium]|jgi:putative glycosytransferase
MKDKIKVLMIGPARDVKGGMTSVIDNYFEYGLNSKVELKYIETINDKCKLLKFFKERKGFIDFKKNINKYDIVHIHMASRRSAFRKGKYLRIAKKNDKKVILHIHGAEFKIFLEECNIKQKKYIEETLNLADKIIVLSEGWKKYFETIVSKDKIEVIYNSIVIPDEFDKDINSSKLLFLGRFGHRKGIYDLIDVIERLHNEDFSVKLYAGGDGEIQKVKSIVKEKNLENNIEILGWIKGKNKENYLRKCSIYILPSYNEGLPMSLIEGMAYKNIPISTNVGGIPELISNNQNGILITPGNKEELYLSIKRLLEDSKLRKKLSDNARKTTEEKFNIKNNIEKLLSVYYQLQR